MKNILQIFIILISLTACESKKSHSVEKKEAKSEIKAQKVELTEREKEEKLRTKINSDYIAELSKCSQNTNAVTNFNGKTEFWEICETDQGKRILKIESHKKTELYEEVYYEQNGELIYAEESIKYMPINHHVLQTWTCQFYIEKGKLVSLMSLGHGKTENENWNPEIIFEMYKKRIIELNKIAKE
ncbi:hypothetical protein [uncultured Kordia sp.]|uniref:hypothetical protein n=1 Tax=uncultured Kordia sp. TaxID=507699 RepID=UPI002636DDCA|nr:hypothetical protein [uncultured Kordia sp.]